MNQEKLKQKKLKAETLLPDGGFLS